MPILTDRTRITTDWRCQRRRFLGYEHGGIGLTPDSLQLELFLGTILHDGLAAIATNPLDIDKIATEAQKAVSVVLAEDQTYALEQAALVEGLLRAFTLHVWPRLMATYPTVVAIEQEMLYAYEDISFMSRPDLVLEDKDGLHYIEYKSTSSKKDQWITSWNYAVQLQSSVKAIEATLGRPVVSVVVVGLYKGYESYGKQSSPFCYSYQRKGNPPFTKDELSYEYRAGFRRVPTWELPNGVKGWVANMPENVLASQFPWTPPIFIKDDLVKAFFDQVYVREHEIDYANLLLDGADDEQTNAILSTSFPQNFEACSPAWGSSCPFKSICHGNADPSQGFTQRVPHHMAELEVLQ